MWNEVQWIKIPDMELRNKQILHGDLGGRFAYFRLEQELLTDARLTARITAVSRYRLWVNDQAVLSGSCKGDLNRQYYETVSLTPYLHAGKNVFAVQVLYNDPDIARDQTDERAAIYGVVGAGNCHALAIDGDITDAFGRVIGTISTGKALWRVWLDHTFYLKSSEYTVYLGATEESVDARRSPLEWKRLDFDASSWSLACASGPVMPSALFQSVGLIPRVHLMPREIPLMEETECAFARVIRRKNDLVLDAGVEVNGYPRFSFNGNAGTEITVTYLERFGNGADGARIDDMGGTVEGRADHIILNGHLVNYEPFWVRTFRFIVVKSSDGKLPEMPAAQVYRKTGYPLSVESTVDSSTPWVGQLWGICLRTLQNCMLETYMDCPYYEQLQFIMDTRLQMLFTYAVSRDARLAKKALLADALAGLVTGIWGDLASLTVLSAWLGLIGYALQLYFDFSGYSDMAIGMAKLFGFDFDANFDHPYLSASLTEFWRRWHISLGRWFRDYVYIPLGGSRVSTPKCIRNRLSVWILTGLWHGASWTFVAWGLYHGILLLLEKYPLKGILAKTPSPIRHILTLLAVIVGWVLFSSPDFSSAIFYLGRMFGAGSRAFWDSTAKYYFAANWKLLVLGILGCGPWIRTLYRHLVFSRRSPGLVLSALLLIGIFLLCVPYMTNATYQSFLYAQF